MTSKAKSKEYYVTVKNLKNGKLVLGDCMEYMPRIPDKSVQLVLVDLPYGTTKNSWDTILPLDELWNQYNRVLVDTGIAVFTASQPFTTTLINSNPKNFRYAMVWDKGRASGSLLAKKRPLKYHEDLLVFYRKPGTYNPVMRKGKLMKKASGGKSANYRDTKIVRYENDLYYPTSILSYKRPHNMQGKIHPTQKPVELFEYLVRLYSNPGDTVLDNTAGVLTTAIACELTDRRYICIEKEEKYFHAGIKNLRSII